MTALPRHHVLASGRRRPIREDSTHSREVLDERTKLPVDDRELLVHELQLTDLVTSIDGLTAVGAAAILAETGDLNRFRGPRSVVKHAGLCPRDNSSGTQQGKTSISGRGRPALRLAAWRAVWPAVANNPVLAARFAYLTTREHNRLARQQARTACAAALLRWLHVVVTQQVAWDPSIAAGKPLTVAA